MYCTLDGKKDSKEASSKLTSVVPLSNRIITPEDLDAETERLEADYNRKWFTYEVTLDYKRSFLKSRT